MFVFGGPLFIMGVEVLEVLQFDVVFKIPVALLNLLHKLRNIGLQVDEQIGRLDEIDHRMEEIQVALVVAIIDKATGVEVGSENVGILIDGPVLDDGLVALPDLPHLVETAVEEEDLEVKRPALHVIVEIAQVGIIVDRLIQRHPTVVLRQLFHERGFA